MHQVGVWVKSVVTCGVLPSVVAMVGSLTFVEPVAAAFWSKPKEEPPALNFGFVVIALTGAIVGITTLLFCCCRGQRVHPSPSVPRSEDSKGVTISSAMSNHALPKLKSPPEGSTSSMSPSPSSARTFALENSGGLGAAAKGPANSSITQVLDPQGLPSPHQGSQVSQVQRLKKHFEGLFTSPSAGNEGAVGLGSAKPQLKQIDSASHSRPVAAGVLADFAQVGGDLSGCSSSTPESASSPKPEIRDVEPGIDVVPAKPVIIAGVGQSNPSLSDTRDQISQFLHAKQDGPESPRNLGKQPSVSVQSGGPSPESSKTTKGKRLKERLGDVFKPGKKGPSSSKNLVISPPTAKYRLASVACSSTFVQAALPIDPVEAARNRASALKEAQALVELAFDRVRAEPRPGWVEGVFRTSGQKRAIEAFEASVKEAREASGEPLTKEVFSRIAVENEIGIEEIADLAKRVVRSLMTAGQPLVPAGFFSSVAVSGRSEVDIALELGEMVKGLPAENTALLKLIVGELHHLISRMEETKMNEKAFGVVWGLNLSDDLAMNGLLEVMIKHPQLVFPELNAGVAQLAVPVSNG